MDMKKELRLKNNVFPVLYMAAFVFVCIVACCLLGLAIDGVAHCILVLGIGATVIGGVWIVAVVALVFCGTVDVTAERIVFRRGKTIKWVLEREKIKVCLYQKMPWYGWFIPSAAIDSFTVRFKLYDFGVSHKECSLSVRKVKLLQEMGYPFSIDDGKGT